MKITELDLSNLLYDPSSKKDIQRLQKENPNIFDMDLFENHKLCQFHECILRYIILVYDMRSPLHVTIKNHNERKVKAMLMSGLEADDLGKFNGEIEQALLYGKDSGVARMIVKYIYLFNSVDYSELMGMIEINSQILRKIHNDKTTKDTLAQLQTTSKRIKELTVAVFGGAETKEIEEQLYEQLNMSRISFRPEMIARQYADKDAKIFKKDKYGSKRRV